MAKGGSQVKAVLARERSEVDPKWRWHAPRCGAMMPALRRESATV